jgi:hypothetical protein
MQKIELKIWIGTLVITLITLILLLGIWNGLILIIGDENEILFEFQSHPLKELFLKEVAHEP